MIRNVFWPKMNTSFKSVVEPCLLSHSRVKEISSVQVIKALRHSITTRINFKSADSKKLMLNKKYTESLQACRVLSQSPKTISFLFGVSLANITSMSPKRSTKIWWKKKLLSSIANSVINLVSFWPKKAKSSPSDKTLTVNWELTCRLQLSDKSYKKLTKFLW